MQKYRNLLSLEVATHAAVLHQARVITQGFKQDDTSSLSVQTPLLYVGVSTSSYVPK